MRRADRTRSAQRARKVARRGPAKEGAGREAVRDGLGGEAPLGRDGLARLRRCMVSDIAAVEGGDPVERSRRGTRQGLQGSERARCYTGWRVSEGSGGKGGQGGEEGRPSTAGTGAGEAEQGKSARANRVRRVSPMRPRGRMFERSAAAHSSGKKKGRYEGMTHWRTRSLKASPRARRGRRKAQLCKAVPPRRAAASSAGTAAR